MENSLYYLLVLISTAIFCVSLVLILANPFFNLAVSAVKQLNIILDKTLDESEVDKLILNNLFKLLANLFLNITLLIGLIVLSSLPTVLYVEYISDVEADTSSIYFYISMFIGSVSLLLFKNKADYSYWSNLLHTVT